MLDFVDKVLVNTLCVTYLTYALLLAVDCRLHTTCLLPALSLAVMSIVPPAVPETCCPHFFLLNCFAVCGPRELENRPDPFLGQMA